MTNTTNCARVLALLPMLCAAAACDSDADAEGEGTLRVTIYGEDFIEDRVPADEVIDGWEVVFTRFLVAVHDVEADGIAMDGTWVYDLRPSSGGNGHDVASMPMPAGTVEHLDYRIGPASSDATGNVDAQTISAMADAGYSLWVQGTATRDDVTLTFDWGFATDTAYTQCETGQDLADGGEATSQMTIHSDHLLYDDLESEEPNVAFDIIARADTDGDGDGDITLEELAAVDITGEARYQVGSRDITEMRSFIAAQTATVGHIDGEGHCETK